MAKQKTTPKKPSDENTDTDETETDTDTDTETDPEEENKRINAIVTNRVKREMKPLLQMMQQMQETMKSMAPKKDEDEEETEETDTETETAQTQKKPAPKANDATSKRMTRLERELAEQKARAEKAERERAEQAEASKRQEMRNIFQGALAEYGIKDPLLLEAALDRLEKTGQMFRDEDGKVKFKGVDKYGIDTNFDPRVGLKTWVEKEGKSYVPAVEAGGSGSGGARNGGEHTNMGKSQYAKLSEVEKARIELDRASQGLPPLE